MFNKPKNNQEELETLKNQLAEERHSREMERQRMDQEKELALKEKEFELKHFKDDEIQKLREDAAEKDQEIAVLRKENEMLDKITNLNADIIDIKDLVSKLIDKLPEVNLKNLTISNGSDK